MTEPDDWIAPGAALHDPALQAEVAPRRKRNLSDLMPDQSAAARAILARYPWQEYAYKVGRWQRQPGMLFERFKDYDVWARNPLPIQLIHPTTGVPVAELQSKAWGDLPKPQGRLWLAGDPRLIVVCTPAGDGVKLLDLAVCTSARGLDLLKIVGDLRPGEMLPEPPTPFHYQETFPYGRSTWIADRPGKPRRRDGFHWGDEPKRTPEEEVAATAELEAQRAVSRAENERSKPTTGFLGWLHRL